MNEINIKTRRWDEDEVEAEKENNKKTQIHSKNGEKVFQFCSTYLQTYTFSSSSKWRKKKTFAQLIIFEEFNSSFMKEFFLFLFSNSFFHFWLIVFDFVPYYLCSPSSEDEDDQFNGKT